MSTDEKGGYDFPSRGFGRMLAKGSLISKPVEALPPYGPGARTGTAVAAAPQENAEAPAPTEQPSFQSSAQAI